MAGEDTQRTQWAEEFGHKFASQPLVYECVFRSPKRLDGVEKEVCDLLIVLRKQAIVVQMKCQEDPAGRVGTKLERWVLKQAKGCRDQLQGACNTLFNTAVWCEHPRRGRVEFNAGELHVVHGIALVEHFQNRIYLPRDFPLFHDGVPLSYFTTNDFLNVVNELRAFPEILSYLNQRHELDEDLLRGVGGERAFYDYYLLKNGGFTGWTTYTEIENLLAESEVKLKGLKLAKQYADKDASLIEYVSDALATRSGEYAEGLSPDWIKKFDVEPHRRNYLRMQEELCDLGLSERRQLGAQFSRVLQKVQASPKETDMTYCVAYFDSKPNFIYVLVSSKGTVRQVLLQRMDFLLRGALAYFQKLSGMVVADRGGKSFEVLLRADFAPRESDVRLGQHYFASLKISTSPGGLAPN